MVPDGDTKDTKQQDVSVLHCAYYEKRGRGGGYLPQIRQAKPRSLNTANVLQNE